MTSRGSATMPEAVEVKGLGIQLGDYRALTDVNFAAEPGDTVAILGPNGAGKTVLIKAILGILPAAAGEVRLFGRPVSEVPPEWIGYVPQQKTLDRSFPATTCDLVVSGKRRSWPGQISSSEHKMADKALAAVGAGHLCHKPLSWLSGGELERVYLARALIREPRLLLLDEPATGIDIVGEDDMYCYIEDYQKRSEAVVLMVTHDWIAAHHHASKALLLNRGVISFGAPEESLSDESMRAAFGHVGHIHGPCPEAPDA